METEEVIEEADIEDLDVNDANHMEDMDLDIDSGNDGVAVVIKMKNQEEKGDMFNDDLSIEIPRNTNSNNHLQLDNEFNV